MASNPSYLPVKPGQFARYRGSWGRVIFVGPSFVFLEMWRGQVITTAPSDEIQEVKGNERLGQDERRQLGRRLTDY